MIVKVWPSRTIGRPSTDDIAAVFALPEPVAEHRHRPVRSAAAAVVVR